jgi:hypothetical protein
MASPSSSVPAIQFTPSGIVLPADSEILAGVQADQNTAFGGGLNPSLEAPQGQLASSDTAIIAEKNSEIAYVVNQVDPQYASGRFQDAIGRIYFMDRKVAQPTIVTATLSGLVGAVIPTASQAKDTSGNKYTLAAQVTIGSDGTAQGVFQNIVNGPIPCADNTLTQVYQAVPGWDAVNNPTLTGGIASAVLGRNVESRADFEYRRQASVAVNGNGTTQAIRGNVFEVDGVQDCYVVDNDEGETVNTGSTNYPMIKSSVYVAVLGGDANSVALATWKKKSLGCSYNGNTTVIVTDPSGYNFPAPTYTVKFERPASLPIYFAVQIVNDPSLPSNIVSLVQQAIFNRFYGLDDTNRERIGATVFVTRYYGAIASVADNVPILEVLIGTTSTPTALKVAVGIDQTPSLSLANISVTLVTP